MKTQQQAIYEMNVLLHFDKWCQCFSFNQGSPAQANCILKMLILY